MAERQGTTFNNSMERLLEALDDKTTPVAIVQARARAMLREAATHTLYDVDESDRAVVATVGTFLIARERIVLDHSCFTI